MSTPFDYWSTVIDIIPRHSNIPETSAALYAHGERRQALLRLARRALNSEPGNTWMEKNMRFWQSLAMLDTKELPVLAQHAEALGFEGVSLGEHVVTFSEQYDQYTYTENHQIRWYPETHWPEPWVQIAALSQITKTLQFMTSVYILPMHSPFNAAKSIATAANISDGRVTLGAGIGWQKSEFALFEQDFHNRGKHCDEMLEIMGKLWTGEPVSHAGEFFNFPMLQMSPGLETSLPIYIGGFSQAALQRAARYDGWIGAEHDMQEVEAITSTLHRFRRESGLSAKAFDICLGLHETSQENIERCQELGVTQIYRNAFCDPNGMASSMSLAEKLHDMDSFATRYLQ